MYEGQVRERIAKFAKELKTVQMTEARKILGFSRTTSDTVLRAELGMYPPIHKQRLEEVESRPAVTPLPGPRPYLLL